MACTAIETIRAVKRCINDEFRIIDANKVFELVEKENGQILNVTWHGSSDAICLDIDKKRVKNINGTEAKDQTFPFFNPNERGLLKKNDAIFLCSREGRLFVFLIEMKQRNEGKYLLQMKAGRMFVEFLFNILTLHEKCTQSKPHFFGVLCYGPEKKSVDKELFRHSEKFDFEERNGLLTSSFYSSALDLQDLMNAAKRSLPIGA